jgi:hypothetical protein
MPYCNKSDVSDYETKDFNSITYTRDRYNGSDVSDYETKDFMEWIYSANVLEAHSLKCFYTWSNGTVWSRIDRVFINGE